MQLYYITEKRKQRPFFKDSKKKPYAPAEEGDTVPSPLAVFQSPRDE
ncbi:hypothetical protein B4113_2185 [Geobacillus sp. B4113_201601]|nr:hypothetical protein B4113_2185 [Geobacillus sp. B4113_201601]